MKVFHWHTKKNHLRSWIFLSHSNFVQSSPNQKKIWQNSINRTWHIYISLCNYFLSNTKLFILIKMSYISSKILRPISSQNPVWAELIPFLGGEWQPCYRVACRKCWRKSPGPGIPHKMWPFFSIIFSFNTLPSVKINVINYSAHTTQDSCKQILKIKT